MEIIRQPQPSSQRDPGYWTIADSVGCSIMFHSQLAIPYGISVLFVRIPHCKNEHQDKAAKIITVGQKYHN